MAPEIPLDVDLLRQLFRNLLSWRSLYLEEGKYAITGPDGIELTIFDLEYLYENLHRIPPRRAEAIELFLVQNKMERDTAIAMGVSPNNPMGAECTKGLKDLLVLIEAGKLPRFVVKKSHKEVV